MNTWVELVQRGALVAVTVAVAHQVLIWIVVIWSLRADEAGRDHALRVLKLLRLQIRHDGSAEQVSEVAPDDAPTEIEEPKARMRRPRNRSSPSALRNGRPPADGMTTSPRSRR